MANVEEYHEYGPIYSHDWDDHVLVNSYDWDEPYFYGSDYSPGYYFVHKEDGPTAGPFDSVTQALEWFSYFL